MPVRSSEQHWHKGTPSAIAFTIAIVSRPFRTFTSDCGSTLITPPCLDSVTACIVCIETWLPSYSSSPFPHLDPLNHRHQFSLHTVVAMSLPKRIIKVSGVIVERAVVPGIHTDARADHFGLPRVHASTMRFCATYVTPNRSLDHPFCRRPKGSLLTQHPVSAQPLTRTT